MLKQESDGLTPGSDAGFAQQAKSKAQQLAIIGKIKLEELKFGGLHTNIGRAIVEGELNESIRCDTTAQVLSQIKEQRDGVAKCSAELKESTTALTASGKRLSATVGLASIGSSRDLAAAVKLCAKNVKQHESDLEAATRGLVDALQKVDVGSLPISLATLVSGLENTTEHDLAGRAKKYKRKGFETAALARAYWSGLNNRTRIVACVAAISAAVVILLFLSQVTRSTSSPLDSIALSSQHDADEGGHVDDAESFRKPGRTREEAVAHSDDWYERAIKGVVFEKPHGSTCEFGVQDEQYYVKTGYRDNGHFDQVYRRRDRKAVDAVIVGKWWVENRMIRSRVQEVHIEDKDTPIAEQLTRTKGMTLQGMQILAVDEKSLTVKSEIASQTIRFGRIVMTPEDLIQADSRLQEMEMPNTPGIYELANALVDAARQGLLEGRYLPQE